MDTSGAKPRADTRRHGSVSSSERRMRAQPAAHLTSARGTPLSRRIRSNLALVIRPTSDSAQLRPDDKRALIAFLKASAIQRSAHFRLLVNPWKLPRTNSSLTRALAGFNCLFVARSRSTSGWSATRTERRRSLPVKSGPVRLKENAHRGEVPMDPEVACNAYLIQYANQFRPSRNTIWWGISENKGRSLSRSCRLRLRDPAFRNIRVSCSAQPKRSAKRENRRPLVFTRISSATARTSVVPDHVGV